MAGGRALAAVGSQLHGDEEEEEEEEEEEDEGEDWMSKRWQCPVQELERKKRTGRSGDWYSTVPSGYNLRFHFLTLESLYLYRNRVRSLFTEADAGLFDPKSPTQHHPAPSCLASATLVAIGQPRLRNASHCHGDRC
jgi:hypothetical protein